MKNAFLILLLLAITASCGSESTDSSSDDSKKEMDESPQVEKAPTESEEIVDVVDEEPEVFKGDASIMLGTWNGEMNGKKFSVVIESVNETSLSGYNVLGSNRRDIKGTYEQGIWDQPCSKAFAASLAEPGDDKWDGVFQIKFVGYEDTDESDEGLECMGRLKGYEAFGEWKSNNGKMNHRFELIKK